MAVHSNRIHPILDDSGGEPHQRGVSQSKARSKVSCFCAKLEDEYRCLLTGVACVGNHIIVCDNENKNIKRFTAVGEYVNSLTMKDPCGICSVPGSPREVVVTQPDDHLISFCYVDDELRVNSDIPTIKKYESIAALDEVKLVVGCCELGSASVDVIDYNGSVLRSIQRKEAGTRLFRNPAAITCLNSGEILVSDPGRNVLICISPEGEVEFTYDPEGRPSGICVNKDGAIYMAQYDANSVYRLTSEGVKVSVIDDGGCSVKSPLALAVMTDTLVLTEEMPSDRVILIKLPHTAANARQATNLSLSGVRVWLHQSPRSTNLCDLPDA